MPTSCSTPRHDGVAYMGPRLLAVRAAVSERNSDSGPQNASAPAPVLVDPLAADPRPGTPGLSSSRSNSTSGLAQHIAHHAGPWSTLM